MGVDVYVGLSVVLGDDVCVCCIVGCVWKGIGVCWIVDDEFSFWELGLGNCGCWV